jgi:predicted cupin superfamily sugar epimerase
MDPQIIIDWLKLQPNTQEGGYFAGTYTSAIGIDSKDLPGFKPIKEKRPICGAIYYFLNAGDFSAMHKVTGDMLYHFYSGDPVQMLLLYPENSPNRSEVCIFSNDIASGGNPMKLIPGGTWLGSRLTPDGNYALMGVTMSPGFNPADYSIAKRHDLIKQYPEQEALILDLTRS